MSKSHTNLVDLGRGNFPPMESEKNCRRVMTAPGDLWELDEDKATSSVSSDVSKDRMIIVAYHLPVRADRRQDNSGWSFSWEEDSLILQLKDGLPEEMEVMYVGTLKVDVDVNEQDDVSEHLKEEFKCTPTFLPPDILSDFYNGFCKHFLWPLFHYMLPFSADHGDQFDQTKWQAYVRANRLFTNAVKEVINPDNDYVWIHDYHLMLLPLNLRRHFNNLRIGFFLHSPFPSSEIYRTLPVREVILKSLLNCDLIGFHTFDYARHFLSCCSRILGLDYQLKRGYIYLEYYGRTIGIKVMPIGVHMGQIESALGLAYKKGSAGVLKKQFEGKIVLLGVDDMDIFKGIELKLLAMEQMLKKNPDWQGRAVLVQIANPARGWGKDMGKIKDDIESSCNRINQEFGQTGYEPIVFIDRQISVTERVAYYTIAECVVITALRDGMNLIPYEYVICRQGADSDTSGPKKSMLVVSEFVGCSPSLSGAIQVNPWHIEATAEAMGKAIQMSEPEKQLRHEKNHRYVSTHDVTYWSRSFLQDMERTCSDNFALRCWGMGLGFDYRVVALDPNFRSLSMEAIIEAYKSAKSRALLLDYDGTMIPQSSVNKKPSQKVISILKLLCSDVKNTVFIVSGRGRGTLGEWFSPCKKLGIAAENGYFLRWSKEDEWEICSQNSEFGWMKIAEPVMKLYTEATDGSYIETKESGLVWHHQDVDLHLGSCQAKEMLDHVRSVLANEPVTVKSGQSIVEVKPQGVSKGLVAEKIFTSMVGNGRPANFVLCIGDDRSDEDMFETVDNAISSGVLSSDTAMFSCTVGQKRSKAGYYLDDTTKVIEMLELLAKTSTSSIARDYSSS